ANNYYPNYYPENYPLIFHFCFLLLGVSQNALRHLGQVNGFNSLFLGHHTYSQRSHLKALRVEIPILYTINLHFISITLIQYLYMFNINCITLTVSLYG